MPANGFENFRHVVWSVVTEGLTVILLWLFRSDQFEFERYVWNAFGTVVVFL